MRHTIGAGKHEGPQIDMTRGHAFADKGRAGGKRQRRLGDEIVGVGLQLGAENVDLILGRSGPTSMP
jgi:hypothetical protein